MAVTRASSCPRHGQMQAAATVVSRRKPAALSAAAAASCAQVPQLGSQAVSCTMCRGWQETARQHRQDLVEVGFLGKAPLLSRCRTRLNPNKQDAVHIVLPVPQQCTKKQYCRNRALHYALRTAECSTVCLCVCRIPKGQSPPDLCSSARLTSEGSVGPCLSLETR